MQGGEKRMIHFQPKCNLLTVKNQNPISQCLIEESLKPRHSLPLLAKTVSVFSKISIWTSLTLRSFNQVSVVTDVKDIFLTGFHPLEVSHARSLWSATSCGHDLS